jgi:hypothetical protein
MAKRTEKGAVPVDAVPAVAAVSAVAAAQVVAAQVDSQTAECEALGRALAADDAGSGDRFAEGRRLGLLPAVQGEKESGEDYQKRCKAFEPPKEAMTAMLRAYVVASQLRETRTFSVFVENETTGKCRDAKPGDNPAKVRTFTPVECYLMDKETFKALPGDSKSPDYDFTVKGRVNGSRVAMQGIGHARKSRFLSDAVAAGRIVEAATGVAKSGGGRGRGKPLAEKLAAFYKSGIAQTTAQGADVGLAFKAAGSAFVADLIARKVITKEQWEAATK